MHDSGGVTLDGAHKSVQESPSCNFAWSMCLKKSKSPSDRKL